MQNGLASREGARLLRKCAKLVLLIMLARTRLPTGSTATSARFCSVLLGPTLRLSLPLGLLPEYPYAFRHYSRGLILGGPAPSRVLLRGSRAARGERATWARGSYVLH